MRISLFCILFFCGFNSFGKNVDTSSFNMKKYFNFELKCFIDTVKPNTIGQGKYMVIVANFYQIDENKDNYCFCLGYIMSEMEFNYVEPDFVYYYKNEIVLIQTPPKTEIKFLKDLGATKLDNNDSTKIFAKLYPISKGGITGTSQGILICKNSNNIEKFFYDNSDDIPFDKYIYRYFPQKGIIEQIDGKK